MPQQDLAARQCEPCRGGVPPMDRATAEEYLVQVPGWSLKTDPEQQRVLKRADQCVEDGRLDLIEPLAVGSTIYPLEDTRLIGAPNVSFGFGPVVSPAPM